VRVRRPGPRAADAAVRTGVEGFVLAGGLSTRFGSDKALVLHRGRPLIRHALAALEELGGTPRVVARDHGPYREFAHVFVVSERAGRGPAEGLRAALAACSTPLAVVLAADMPGVTGAALRRLLDARDDPSIEAVCFQQGGRRHPLPGVYAASLRRLWEGTPPESLHAVLEAARAVTVGTEDAATVRNVNRPGDLENG